MKRFLTCVAAAALLTSAGAAKATIIDFEAGAVNAAVGADYAASGATFSNAFYKTCQGGCPDPAYGQFTSSANFVDTFVVTFASLQSSVSFVNVTLSSVFAAAYDSSHTLIASLSNSTGFNLDSLSLNGPGIKTVEFSGLDGQGFGIDNLSATGGGVPEPASWALMFMGFGGLGAVLRRRRTVALAA